MDLLEYLKRDEIGKNVPLAERMRPKSLSDIIGQDHILGKGKLLYRMIEADQLASIILYGPPGTGKTSVANVIANTTKAEFVKINATTSGKAEMKEVTDKATDNIRMFGKKTVLFIDEIHRFNKAQQDYLLPFVEKGTIILIGATTENPYFEVNKALLSRSQIFELKELSRENIIFLLEKAVYDKECGMGDYNPEIAKDAIEFLADMTGGDARESLNAIELAVKTTEKSKDGKVYISLDIIKECVQKRSAKYDKDGNNHYDTISAFIKSMRGSDPDATIYYLARMLYAGEDIKFIARRIMICAAEDVGLADANALVVATNASLAVERIGMPEARIILAEAALYVARAKKSNSAIMAVDSALDYVENHPDYQIPSYLKDAHYPGAQSLGNGIGYQYPHDYHGHYVDQEYLPTEVRKEHFYHPSDNGNESSLR